MTAEQTLQVGDLELRKTEGGWQYKSEDQGATAEWVDATNVLGAFGGDGINDLLDELADAKQQSESTEPTPRTTQTFAEALIAQLKGSGAQNYLEDDFDLVIDGAPALRGLIVTVQYGDRPSPHQLRLDAEAERDKLLARVAELSKMVGTLADELETMNDNYRESIDEEMAEPEQEVLACEANDELIETARNLVTASA